MIALGGRLPQIVMNLRRKESGELSLTTCLLNLMGNITRVRRCTSVLEMAIASTSASFCHILIGCRANVRLIQ